MQARQIHAAHGQRTFVAILGTGDEIPACLGLFAEEHRLSAAQVTAIGAFEGATLRFFSGETREFEPVLLEAQVEVLPLNGDIALDTDGKPKPHLHALSGRRDGSLIANDPGNGKVRPTLEVVITESPAHLRRAKDPRSGLALIRFAQPER